MEHSNDNDQGLVFHYNREERLAMKGHPGSETGGGGLMGLIRRNRTLAIVILDVTLAVLVFLLYWFFLRGDPSSELMHGYRFEFRAVAFAEDVLISLSIDDELSSSGRGGDAGDESGGGMQTRHELFRPGSAVVVQVFDEAGDAVVNALETLPSRTSQTLRLRVPLSGVEGEELRARILPSRAGEQGDALEESVELAVELVSHIQPE